MLIRNYKQNAPIDRIEYLWMEKCANNALMYLKEDNIEAECTSYDRKMCYGNILGSDIKIPTQPGCEFTLDRACPGQTECKVLVLVYFG